MRQQYLFEHTKSTKAQAWQSAHNFGLAADFVPMDPDGLWSWRDDEDWFWLGHRARECGLSQPIKWDRPICFEHAEVAFGFFFFEIACEDVA